MEFRWNSRAIGMMAPLFIAITILVFSIDYYGLSQVLEEKKNFLNYYFAICIVIVVISFILSTTIVGKMNQKLQFIGFIIEVLMFGYEFFILAWALAYINNGTISSNSRLNWLNVANMVFVVCYIVGIIVSWHLMKNGVFSEKSKGILNSLYSLDKYLSGFTLAGALIVPPIIRMISGSFMDLETLFMASLGIFLGLIIIFFAGTMTLTAIAKFKYESFNPPMIKKEEKKTKRK